MGLFDLFKKKEEIATPQKQEPEAQISKNTQGHKVAGCNYKQAEIKSLGTINPDYSLKKNELIKKGLLDTPVYEYNFPKYSAALIPEPTNEHDPNAIKVVIADVHVGYIKKGSCSRVRKLMDTNSIKEVGAIVYGGNYKEVIDCGDVTEMTREKGDIKVRLDIEIK